MWRRSSHCESTACVEVNWVTSNYCDTSACVEVAWDKPSRCQHGDCVEVGHSEGQVLMRDSKDPDGPVLQFTKDQWEQFISYLKN